MRRIRGTVLLAALVAPLVVAIGVGPAAANQGVQFAGRVHDSTGASLRGARVVAELLAPNSGVSWSSEGTTDNSGRFSVALPTDGPFDQIAAANGGFANLLIEAVGAAKGRVYRSVRAVSVDMNRPGASVAGDLTATLGAQRSNATPGRGCSNSPWVTTRSGTYWEPVNELHATANMIVTGGYTTQANSDFGVAVEWNSGPWGLNGTSHIGNSGQFGANLAWQGPSWGHQILAQFTAYQQHRTTSCPNTVTDIVSLSAWQGGISVGQDVSSWDGCYGNGYGYCNQPATNHTDFSPAVASAYRNWGRGGEYGGGINAFGLGLGGHSTYSNNMSINWSFRGGVWHSLFGHDGNATNSTYVYAA